MWKTENDLCVSEKAYTEGRSVRNSLDEVDVQVLIRDFRKADLASLLKLLPTCFANEFEVTGFDPDHVTYMVNRGYGSVGRLVRGLLRVVGKEPMKFLVAEVDGKIVGTTIVSDQGKLAYIASVMVDPDYRRRGIASKMIESALDYVRERGKARAVLHVETKNEPAIGVYTNMGFKAFEQVTYFVKDVDSEQLLGTVPNIRIREFQKEDIGVVYELVKASEDSEHLRIFDFSKKEFETTLLQRLFRFSTQKKLVAMSDGEIVGYVSASYTTPKQAGHIASVNVTPEGKTLNVEKLLIEAATNEIIKGGVRRVRLTVSVKKEDLIEKVKGLGFAEALSMYGMAREF